MSGSIGIPMLTAGDCVGPLETVLLGSLSGDGWLAGEVTSLCSFAVQGALSCSLERSEDSRSGKAGISSRTVAYTHTDKSMHTHNVCGALEVMWAIMASQVD